MERLLTLYFRLIFQYRVNKIWAEILFIQLQYGKENFMEKALGVNSKKPYLCHLLKTIIMRKFIKMHILFYETSDILTIDLLDNYIKNWTFTEETTKFIYRTSDRCLLLFETIEGKKYFYKGYVPDFFPSEHYGKYLRFTIEVDGTIQDFSSTDADIEKLFYFPSEDELKEYDLLLWKK